MKSSRRTTAGRCGARSLCVLCALCGDYVGDRRAKNRRATGRICLSVVQRTQRSQRTEFGANDSVALQVDVFVPLLDMLAQCALVPHSELLQHPTRCGVASEM